MSKKYEGANLEKDVLAVLKEGGATVTFVTAPASAIDGLDYQIVSWTKTEMIVCISDEFLSEGLEEIIARQIAMDVDDMHAEGFEDEDVRSYVSQKSIDYLGETLSEILEELLKTEDPAESNFEHGLQLLLEEE